MSALIGWPEDVGFDVEVARSMLYSPSGLRHGTLGAENNIA
jgi:hypothetical protein